MQRNLLYPGKMYENKQKALNDLKDTLNKFTIPIDEYHYDHDHDIDQQNQIQLLS